MKARKKQEYSKYLFYGLFGQNTDGSVSLVFVTDKSELYWLIYNSVGDGFPVPLIYV